jgi:hypothetical protein
MAENTTDAKLLAVEASIRRFTRAGWAFVVLGFLLGAFGIWKLPAEDKFSLANLSALGSYLQGSVSSVWTLAGLFFIYVAFQGQKLQLLKQDIELDEQNKQFSLQNFESIFFQLLTYQNQIVSRFHIGPPSPNNPLGAPAFKEVYQRFGAFVLNRIETEQLDTRQMLDKQFIGDCYEQFYRNYQGELGHYFRHLYRIVKMVKFSDIEERHKRRYTSLVRAQLSAHELGLLFYSCVSPLGAEKFKPLIEEFGLLENLDPQILCHESHKEFYQPAAFE